MIDKTIFATGMGQLAGAFKTNLDPAVSRMYYGILSSRLTTEQFAEAVAAALATETFWPSPAKLLEKVKADDETRGLLGFEHVNRVLGNNGGLRYLTTETYNREFDAPTRAAISAVGGLGAITNTSEERWGSLQKRFAAAFTTATQPRIAAPQTDPRVKQLVGNVASYLTSGRDLAAGKDP